MQEPLEQYLQAFDHYRGAVEDLLEVTVDLTVIDSPALDILTDPSLLTALRYLAGPPISEDDLKTLAEVPGRASQVGVSPLYPGPPPFRFTGGTIDRSRSTSAASLTSIASARQRCCSGTSEEGSGDELASWHDTATRCVIAFRRNWAGRLSEASQPRRARAPLGLSRPLPEKLTVTLWLAAASGGRSTTARPVRGSAATEARTRPALRTTIVPT